MTFILGSKCSNGVVLVADKKITVTDNTGMYFDYRDKLFAELRHVISGSPGLRVPQGTMNISGAV
jgi:20S proteasome alpha/beta subunit